MDDIAPIILAVGVVITALTSAYNIIIAQKAKIAAEAAAIVALEVRRIADETKAVTNATHDAVNSKMDKLLATVAAAARANGVVEGRAQSAAKT